MGNFIGKNQRINYIELLRSLTANRNTLQVDHFRYDDSICSLYQSKNSCRRNGFLTKHITI